MASSCCIAAGGATFLGKETKSQQRWHGRPIQHMHQDMINSEKCTHACTQYTYTHARAHSLVPDCTVSPPVWHGCLPPVRVVCRCAWSVWITRALACLQLWDARLPRGAPGARPRWERPAFVEYPPQVQRVAPGGRGEGPQWGRSPHCRAPCSVETPRVGSRSCHSSEALSEPNRWGRSVDNTGSSEEVASGYSIRKWPCGSAVHTWSHSIPGAGSHRGTGVRAPFCRRRNWGLERAGPWPRVTQIVSERQHQAFSPGIFVLKLVPVTPTHTSHSNVRGWGAFPGEKAFRREGSCLRPAAGSGPSASLSAGWSWDGPELAPKRTGPPRGKLTARPAPCTRGRACCWVLQYPGEARGAGPPPPPSVPCVSGDSGPVSHL